MSTHHYKIYDKNGQLIASDATIILPELGKVKMSIQDGSGLHADAEHIVNTPAWSAWFYERLEESGDEIEGLKGCINELADECSYQHWLRTRPWPADKARQHPLPTDRCDDPECVTCERIQIARRAAK